MGAFRVLGVPDGDPAARQGASSKHSPALAVRLLFCQVSVTGSIAYRSRFSISQ